MRLSIQFFQVHNHEIRTLLKVSYFSSKPQTVYFREGFRFLFSDGNGADNDSVLQQNADHQEEEVQEKHSGSQHLVHLPVTGGNGDDDEEQHEEEQHNGTEESIAANSHWTETMDGREQQPGDRQTFEIDGEKQS